MAIEITFLGTSCMVPTKDRNVSGIYMQYRDKGILVDCGEGTQRQMNIAGINRNKVTHILITHWHGDHVSGLIGLIQTLGNQQAQNEERPTVRLYGPRETEMRIENMLKTCIFDNKINLEVHELNPLRGQKIEIINSEYFIVEAALLDHGVPCLGYTFVEKDVRRIDMKKIKELGMKEGPLVGNLQNGQSVTFEGNNIEPDMVSNIQKGKKITFILDTAPCEPAVKLSENADLLICEASYASKIEEKAENNKHMTAKQAAIMAGHSNAKKLILTHISQRYKTNEEVLEDAKNYFPAVEVAFDFMRVKL